MLSPVIVSATQLLKVDTFKSNKDELMAMPAACSHSVDIYRKRNDRAFVSSKFVACAADAQSGQLKSTALMAQIMGSDPPLLNYIPKEVVRITHVSRVFI
jgi:hypothetical protein